ncbi:hypothetical protein F2Q70_00029580 [Brassica cretica]|uniref:Uncharacterized protein n=1 Tax=Brassica cretica TaxID=69181 RepID=A0A8S9FS20_BRACR|nr:hypothetical protein F2Q70_00029580 [Brassica cretica]
MHGLMSYRRFGRARSLRSDRAEWMLSRYVATELWFELGRYVVTELWLELATERNGRSTACMCGSCVMTELGSSVFRSSYSDLSVTGLEFVETEGRAEVEEDVNFIGGTGFQRSGNHNGNFYGQRNDDFWQVVKQEKLQEEDFEVESSMSFGGSHWCQSAPDFEHRSTDFNQNRSTGSPEHRSTTPMESTASCNAVRIMTHEEFTA